MESVMKLPFWYPIPGYENELEIFSFRPFYVRTKDDRINLHIHEKDDGHTVYKFWLHNKWHYVFLDQILDKMFGIDLDDYL
jgi:hypothetical protein